MLFKILFTFCSMSHLLEARRSTNPSNLWESVAHINFTRNFPDINPRLYQGDIRMSEGEMELLKSNMTIYQNALLDPKTRWPHKTVPFYVDDIFDDVQYNLIMDAMNHIESETCIQFIKLDSKNVDIHYVFITELDPRECSAYVGHIPQKESPQIVSFGRDGCFDDMGVLEHELLHVLGLDHEHSRPDRDEHVHIYRENIVEGLEFNFNIRVASTTFDQPYDYGSVMQYPNDAFGRTEHGKKLSTMLAKKNPRICLGQRHRATQCDLEKIRKMYGCRVMDNCRPHPQYPRHNKCNEYDYFD